MTDKVPDLRAASAEFASYIADKPRYVSITEQQGPLRPGESHLLAPRRQYIRKIMQWDGRKTCWMNRDGRPLVTRDLIWETMIAEMRQLDTSGQTKIWGIVKEKFDGIHEYDARTVCKAWFKHNLHLLDPRDDSQWDLNAEAHTNTIKPVDALNVDGAGLGVSNVVVGRPLHIDAHPGLWESIKDRTLCSKETSHEKVKAATSAFAVYLQATALPVHYIQVRLRDCPIRRVDHEVGLSPNHEAQVKSTFTWSEAQRRWTRKDNGILVDETEIWHVIQYFIKGTTQDSAIDLYDTIHKQVEGIHYGDVEKVWGLWQDSGLSRAEFSQNVQWVGQKPIKLQGPYGRPPSTAITNYSSAISFSRGHYGSRDKQLSADPSNVQIGAAPHFHPNRPKSLHVGSSRKDGNAVWATIIGSKKQQLRYLNHKLNVVKLKDLDVIWHPHLELDVFQGRHEKEKDRTRRQHIINLIQENTANISNSNGGTPHASTPTPMAVRPRLSTCKRRRTSMATTVDLSNSDTANTSDSNDYTSHASTPTPIVLRPRLSTRKRRRTSMGTTVDSSKSGGLSHSDNYLPSPSRLLDLCEGRQLKKACNEDELLPLQVSSVQTKPTSAYDARPGRSGRTGGHTINNATGHRMIDHTTHDQTFNHATSSLTDRVEEQIVSHERVIRTILRVSTSNRPAKAPISILLGNCRDVDEFYSKVLSECTTSADEVHDLSAVFAWNGRGNLIRKGNHDDWSFFYKELQRSWKRDIDSFTDDTCEVEIMLHIEI